MSVINMLSSFVVMGQHRLKNVLLIKLKSILIFVLPKLLANDYTFVNMHFEIYFF